MLTNLPLCLGFSICIVLNISACSFTLPSGYAELEQQALNSPLCNAPLASLTDVNFPVTSFWISTVRFYSSLSSLFITLAHYWKLLSIFFLSNTLFVFLPVLTVMSLAQALINSCFALCHFLLSALEELHTDCLYQHHLSLLLRHITPHVNLPDSYWHPGVRSSLFCLSLWSSMQLPSSQLPCFCFDSFLVLFEYLRAGFLWLSSCTVRSSTPNIIKNPSRFMYSNFFLVLRLGSLPSKRSLVSLLVTIASGEGSLGKMNL